jgi:uncharacterized protein
MTKARITLLDSLRGLGVLGILICNVPDFAASPGIAESVRHWPHGTGADTVSVWFVTQWLFQRKFVILFSMLFGISVFLVGGERSELEKGAILRKRLMWMVAIGLLHGFVIWYGDVLLSYALAGFAVMLARSWTPRRLLTVGISIWTLFSLLLAVGMTVMILGPDDSAARATEVAAFKAEAALAEVQYSGTFLQSLVQNAKDRLELLPNEIIIFLMTFSLMLVGLGCFKTGVFTGQASTRTYVVLTVVGLLALAGTGAFLTGVVVNNLSRSWLQATEAFQLASAPLTTLAYVSLMVFATRATGFWSAIPRVLAPVGQMAFTNYLTQSLIMTAIFYGGRGPGLHGEIDRPGLALIVIAVWIVQILWSKWWMDRFTMGPLEWLWRRLYRGATPLRRTTEAAVVA